MEDCVLLEPAAQLPLPGDAYDCWLTPDGEIVTQFYRMPAGYLVRFPDLADFAIGAEGEPVTCTPALGAVPHAVSALYYNQVKPLLRNRSGGLVLHGSAVAGPAGALAFIGRSGRGKTTLAAGFARAGVPYLSDDGVVLEPAGPGYAVMPNYPAIRLRPDSESAIFRHRAAQDAGRGDGKRQIEAGASAPFQRQPVPLSALYLLGDGESGALKIERLKQSEALSALLQHAFILDVEDRTRLRGHFERLARLAETADCFAIDYPRHYESLQAVIDGITAHAMLGDTGS